jgi:hypothetical protein
MPPTLVLIDGAGAAATPGGIGASSSRIFGRWPSADDAVEGVQALDDAEDGEGEGAIATSGIAMRQ